MAQFIWYGIFEMGKEALGYVPVPTISVEVDEERKEGGGGADPVIIEGMGLGLSPPDSASSSLVADYSISGVTLVETKKKKRAYSNGSSFGSLGKSAQTIFLFATFVALASALPEGQRRVLTHFAPAGGTTIDGRPMGVSNSDEWLNMDTFGKVIAWVSTSL